MANSIFAPVKRRKKQTNFNQLPTTKKGRGAEKLVASLLEKAGFSVYLPRLNKSHPIDLGLIHNKTLRLSFADVKCYPARADGFSGVDYADFSTYCKLAEQVPVSILFLDEQNQSVRELKLTPEAIKAAQFDEKQEKILWDYYKWTTPIFWLTYSQIERL